MGLIRVTLVTISRLKKVILIGIVKGDLEAFHKIRSVSTNIVVDKILPEEELNDFKRKFKKSTEESVNVTFEEYFET